MRDAIAVIASLPQRSAVFKNLVEAMNKVIGQEREAFGLNTEDGTGGDRWTVLIKDYTGRAYNPPEGQL